MSGIQRYADGLVLTEWKIVKDDEQPANAFAAARAQAKLYSTGILGGVELASYRYAVVVSKGRVEAPDDFQDGQCIYRHINVAVDQETPSVASRRRRTSSKGSGCRV
jgi:hypothetical protein